MVEQLTQKVLEPGNGIDKPKTGDTVSLHYTGCLYQEGETDCRGKEFDSSRERGEFTTVIGIGKVIRGWDEGVLNMSLGEKCELTIPSDKAYGTRGFPGLIPPNSALIFEMQLLAIGGKRA